MVPFAPANSNASAEAHLLLEFLYQIGGTRTLSGQHNNPGSISAFSNEAYALTGHYPAIWGQDWGFSDEAWDGIQFRDQILKAAIEQYQSGSIITLMWHAVRPIEEEPGSFKENVCGAVTNEQWRDLLTPGTQVHDRWIRQSDVVAGLLGKLRDEGIPVLWRPYHEMNGPWFWWGHKRGEQGYSALWRMMFDRFVKHHRLNNLLWVWNANAPHLTAEPYAGYYPGHDVVDCLATDVYHNDYKPSHHDDLLDLGEGRPIALGEVGNVPTPEILEAQSSYAWFMTWSGFLARDNDVAVVRRLYDSPRVLHRHEMITSRDKPPID